jgi:hypothetical protein
MIRSGIGYQNKKRSSRFLRMGTFYLALNSAFPGVWALLSPRSFFDDFPGFGLHWVASFPPYNEHLVRDVGGFFLAFAVLLAAAAFSANRSALRVALGGAFIFAVPHFIFHLQHMSETDAKGAGLGSVLALGATGLLNLILLIAALRNPHP